MIEYAPAPARIASSPVLSPTSDQSIGRFLQAVGVTAPASAAYTAANVALFFPLAIAQPITISGVWWYNGTVTGGNCDVGIYSAAFTRLASVGSTGRGSASAIVRTSLAAAITLPRGSYYLAFAHNGTNNFFRLATAAVLCAAAGVMEQASAFALPATATPSVTTRAYVPMFGLVASANSAGL